MLGVEVGTLVDGNSGRIPCIIILEQSKFYVNKKHSGSIRTFFLWALLLVWWIWSSRLQLSKQDPQRQWTDYSLWCSYTSNTAIQQTALKLWNSMFESSLDANWRHHKCQRLKAVQPVPVLAVDIVCSSPIYAKMKRKTCHWADYRCFRDGLPDVLPAKSKLINRINRLNQLE